MIEKSGVSCQSQVDASFKDSHVQPLHLTGEHSGPERYSDFLQVTQLSSERVLIDFYTRRPGELLSLKETDSSKSL